MSRPAKIAAGAVAALTLLLLVDWAVLSIRLPKNDKAVKALQEKTKQDAAFAPELAALQKRVTDYRQARNRRDRWAGYGLLIASAVFLTLAKRNAPRRIPAATQKATRADTACHHRRRSASIVAEALDVSFVDEAVARIGRGREMAIPLLQAIQTHYRYLPDEALRRVCEITEITPAQIAGTSSFYGQFRRSPVGEHIVKVCHGTACHVAGARQVTDELRRYLDIPEGQDTDPARQFTVEEVACLGCCSLAPVLMVDEQTAGRLTPNTAAEALKPFDQEPA
jgi:NADH:ubiquinone oxidoreductase subunit E